MVITKAAMPEVPILIDAACVASNDDALDEAALKVMESMHVKVRRCEKPAEAPRQGCGAARNL